MRPRKIYWRRKGELIIAEGKTNDKTTYLFQLPDVEIVAKSSLFTKEKQAKILEKISRLDYKPNKEEKEQDEVHTTRIMRTSQNDDFDPEFMVNSFIKEHNLKPGEEEDESEES